VDKAPFRNDSIIRATPLYDFLPRQIFQQIKTEVSLDPPLTYPTRIFLLIISDELIILLGQVAVRRHRIPIKPVVSSIELGQVLVTGRAVVSQGAACHAHTLRVVLFDCEWG